MRVQTQANPESEFWDSKFGMSKLKALVIVVVVVVVEERKQLERKSGCKCFEDASMGRSVFEPMKCACPGTVPAAPLAGLARLPSSVSTFQC